jgi:hypothetical protein
MFEKPATRSAKKVSFMKNLNNLDRQFQPVILSAAQDLFAGRIARRGRSSFAQDDRQGIPHLSLLQVNSLRQIWKSCHIFIGSLVP